MLLSTGTTNDSRVLGERSLNIHMPQVNVVRQYTTISIPNVYVNITVIDRYFFIICLRYVYQTLLGLEVIKFEYSLKLQIKHNDWLLADTCPQATNHCALF